MDLYTVFNVAPRNAESCVLIISDEIEQTRYRSNKYKSNKFNHVMIYSILASIIIFANYI